MFPLRVHSLHLAHEHGNCIRVVEVRKVHLGQAFGHTRDQLVGLNVQNPCHSCRGPPQWQPTARQLDRGSFAIGEANGEHRVPIRRYSSVRECPLSILSVLSPHDNYQGRKFARARISITGKSTVFRSRLIALQIRYLLGDPNHHGSSLTLADQIRPMPIDWGWVGEVIGVDYVRRRDAFQRKPVPERPKEITMLTFIHRESLGVIGSLRPRARRGQLQDRLIRPAYGPQEARSGLMGATLASSAA